MTDRPPVLLSVEEAGREPLLRAIEAALVRVRPEAVLAADHALAHPVHGPVRSDRSVLS
jgi:hypothetical protein